MSDQWAAPTYVDGDFTTAQPCGLPVFSSPIPGSSAEYLFRQPFMQFRKDIAALALGTAHPSTGKTPDYSSFVLVAEGEKQDLGGGIVKWERTYASLPASHDEWESYGHNFIGSSPLGPLASATQVGRNRFTRTVTSRVQHDYFVVASGTETDYLKNSPGNIPVIRAFDCVSQCLITGTQVGSWYQKSDYVADSVVSSNVGILVPTVPTESQYALMIQDAAKNGWGAGTSFQKLTDANPPLVDLTGAQTYSTAQTAFTKRNFPAVTSFYGQLVAEESRLSRWQGNIYLRQTRLVLAL